MCFVLWHQKQTKSDRQSLKSLNLYCNGSVSGFAKCHNHTQKLLMSLCNLPFISGLQSRNYTVIEPVRPVTMSVCSSAQDTPAKQSVRLVGRLPTRGVVTPTKQTLFTLVSLYVGWQLLIRNTSLVAIVGVEFLAANLNNDNLFVNNQTPILMLLNITVTVERQWCCW